MRFWSCSGRLTGWTLFALLLVTPPLFAGKLDPRLAALANQKTPVSPTRLSSQPLSLFAPRVDAHGRVQVDILPSHRGGRLPSVKEIAALGVTRIRISQPMHLIQAWVPIDKLHALAALHRVGWVRVPTYALVEPPPGTYPRLPTPNRQATKPKGVPDTSSTPSHTKDAGGVNPGALGILALILFFRRFHESIAVGSWNHEPTDA